MGGDLGARPSGTGKLRAVVSRSTRPSGVPTEMNISLTEVHDNHLN